MLRYLMAGLLFGLVLAYAGLSMQAYRPGTLLPQALFFGPWVGLFSLVERPLRKYGYWVYLTTPLLYLFYAAILRWSERRARLATATLFLFLFHYCGVLFSAQMVNLAAGEPRRFLLVMKAHGLVMALGFAAFITANVIAIIKGWIAKD
ncbi:MAG: hypothetical protein ABIP12_04770 [Terriglobales bacterium]